MINIHISIIEDLKEYLIKGIHDSTISPLYNGDSFDSTIINNLKYKFILNYEDAENINDKNTIPVLFITYPEQYLKGKLFYKKEFVDITTLLIKYKDNIPKINFFIIPQIIKIKSGNFGSIFYDLKIDYVTKFDTYGFMSKEIDSILKKHYFKECHSKYYSITSKATNLYFVPYEERILNQESLLNRISQTFNVRFCKLI